MPGEYGKVAEKLIATGMDRNTPCLVTSRISSSEEYRYRTILGQLSAVSVRAPSLLIIGDVVGNNVCADEYRALPFQAERETRFGTCAATAD